MNNDTVEFFVANSQRPFLIVDSHFTPDEGELISVKGKTYKVIARSFSVDYSQTPQQCMRCNLIVEAAKEQV